MKILAIESSCDETAAAVVEDGVNVLSSVVASSTAMHQKYGGIVPEVAAREQLRCIIPVIAQALQPFLKPKQQFNNLTIQQFIDAIAVTVGPGLIGSLLVGVETAKTIAFVTKKPFIPVNHVVAHMYANFVSSSIQNSPRALLATRGNLKFPAISLVVSGGHTELYLMQSIKDLRWLGGTLDDAAGEAFDKTARLLGFGSRGGIAIQEAASKFKQLSISNQQLTIKLPRPMLDDDSLNFSFSGLKTAVIREWKKFENAEMTGSDPVRGAFAYEVQEAITDVLVTKTLRAAQIHQAKSILLSGGVAANRRLREKFQLAIRNSQLTVAAPPVSLCTDNAVYIGAYAYLRGQPVDWHKADAVPDLSVEVAS